MTSYSHSHSRLSLKYIPDVLGLPMVTLQPKDGIHFLRDFRDKYPGVSNQFPCNKWNVGHFY